MFCRPILYFLQIKPYYYMYRSSKLGLFAGYMAFTWLGTSSILSGSSHLNPSHHQSSLLASHLRVLDSILRTCSPARSDLFTGHKTRTRTDLCHRNLWYVSITCTCMSIVLEYLTFRHWLTFSTYTLCAPDVCSFCDLQKTLASLFLGTGNYFIFRILHDTGVLPVAFICASD